ncbi:MAG TPA: hypothetical protein VJZ27_02715, partial [Aggregatilineales bacterium]|nr:hypothetical protein [Aggregatilineales bacterium]
GDYELYESPRVIVIDHLPRQLRMFQNVLENDLVCYLRIVDFGDWERLMRVQKESELIIASVRSAQDESELGTQFRGYEMMMALGAWALVYVYEADYQPGENKSTGKLRFAPDRILHKPIVEHAALSEVRYILKVLKRARNEAGSDS